MQLLLFSTNNLHIQAWQKLRMMIKIQVRSAIKVQDGTCNQEVADGCIMTGLISNN